MKSRLPSSFLTIWFGQLLSCLGTGMTSFALGVSVYLESRSAVGFAMVILSLYLPSIVLRPIGGVLADRFDRRMIMATADAGSALGVLFLLVNLLTDSLAPWKIFSGVALTSAVAALQAPAYKASVADYLDEDQYSGASGLIQLSHSTQHLFAPLAAGLLVTLGWLQAVLIVDVCTYVIGITTVLAVGNRMRRERGWKSGQIRRSAIGVDQQGATGTVGRFLVDMQVGWLAIASDRGLLGVVAKNSAVTFFVGVLQTLFGPMMLSITSARSLGLIQSFGAAGMVAVSLILGFVELRRHEKVLRIGLVCAGLSLFAVGRGIALVLQLCGLGIICVAAVKGGFRSSAASRLLPDGRIPLARTTHTRGEGSDELSVEHSSYAVGRR